MSQLLYSLCAESEEMFTTDKFMFECNIRVSEDSFASNIEPSSGEKSGQDIVPFLWSECRILLSFSNSPFSVLELPTILRRLAASSDSFG